MRLSPDSTRPGGTTATTALLLVPLLALAAFAVDLNHLWRADAQLQVAADAAAQAGATRLLGFAVRAAQPGLTEAERAALRDEAAAAVRERAVAYGGMHRAADEALTVNAEDVELGFITDPGARPDTPEGQFQTGSAAPFPNAVRVTVRRDGSVAAGPVRLFFGPVLGTPTSARRATSTACLRGQNVTGFSGSRSGLLPLGLSLTYYQYLLGTVPAPPNLLQDGYTVAHRIDGAPPPPANVTPGPDRVPEVTFYPNKDAPGNYGTLSLINAKETDQGAYSNWILNGPSAADLATFGPGGLRISSSVSVTMHGGPGLKAPLTNDMVAIIGQPRVLVIVGPPSGNGSNVTYPVVGFAGATVVAVDKGKEGVSLQLSPIVSASAILGGGPDAGPGRFVYRGISLAR